MKKSFKYSLLKVHRFYSYICSNWLNCFLFFFSISTLNTVISKSTHHGWLAQEWNPSMGHGNEWVTSVKFNLDILCNFNALQSRDRSHRIVTGWTARIQFLVGARFFSLLYGVQADPEAHWASYPMGVGDSFHGVKVAGALSRPLVST
jgi:hypothetical protein